MGVGVGETSIWMARVSRGMSHFQQQVMSHKGSACLVVGVSRGRCAMSHVTEIHHATQIFERKSKTRVPHTDKTDDQDNKHGKTKLEQESNQTWKGTSTGPHYDPTQQV